MASMVSAVSMMLDACAIFRAYFEVRGHASIVAQSHLTALRYYLRVDLVWGTAAASLSMYNLRARLAQSSHIACWGVLEAVAVWAWVVKCSVIAYSTTSGCLGFSSAIRTSTERNVIKMAVLRLWSSRADGRSEVGCTGRRIIIHDYLVQVIAWAHWAINGSLICVRDSA